MARKKSTSQRKYSQKAGQEVHKEMHQFKQKTTQSGKEHTAVKIQAQAIAIGLSEAREKGEKVPTAPAVPSKKDASSRSRTNTSTTGGKSHTKKAYSTPRSTTTQRSSSRNSHVRRARYSGY